MRKENDVVEHLLAAAVGFAAGVAISSTFADTTVTVVSETSVNAEVERAPELIDARVFDDGSTRKLLDLPSSDNKQDTMLTNVHIDGNGTVIMDPKVVPFVIRQRVVNNIAKRRNFVPQGYRAEIDDEHSTITLVKDT